MGGSKRIIDREDDYRRRRLNRIISPARNDPFAMVRSRLFPLPAGTRRRRFLERRRLPQGDKTPDPSVRTYSEIMKEQAFAREREITMRQIADKQGEAAARRAEEQDASRPTKASGMQAALPPAPQLVAAGPPEAAVGEKRRKGNRWDVAKCACPLSPPSITIYLRRSLTVRAGCFAGPHLSGMRMRQAPLASAASGTARMPRRGRMPHLGGWGGVLRRRRAGVTAGTRRLLRGYEVCCPFARVRARPCTAIESVGYNTQVP